MEGGKMERFMKSANIIILIFLFCITSLFAQEGFLRVTSVPDGAAIEIAAKSVGKTPLLTVMKPGDYAIKATLTGYNAYTENIKIVENEVALVQITLTKTAQKSVFQKMWREGKGNLTVIADRENVDIFLDGVKVKDKPPVTIKDIQSGMHNVILVSGEMADSSRVVIENGKTAVIKKSFEEVAKNVTTLSKAEQEALAKKKAAELELKRQALPAKVILRLANPAAREGEPSTWAEGTSITLSFQYRKTGGTDWTIKELQSKTKLEDTFTAEKGTYDVQFVATHYKEPTSIIDVFLGTKKEKVKEYKESFKLELKPDVQYTYTILYDGKGDFSYKAAEQQLNTPVE